MALLQTFAPFPDESGLGYYRRLSCANRLLNWQELARVAQVSTYRTSLLGRPDFVAGQLGLESAWTTHASQKEVIARGWKALHRRAGEAVCPQCLQEGSYIRNYWEHTFVTACPQHGCQLLERCPSCEAWLDTEREHIHACACGYDLACAHSKPASKQQQWVSAQLSSSTPKPGAIAYPIKRLEPSALSQLIKLLCTHWDVNASGPRRNSALPQSVEEAIEFMHPLETLLVNWPKGFEDHVRARVAAGPIAARTLNTRLGAWFKGLKKACEHPSLKPFMDVTLRVAQEDFDGRITGFDESLVGPVHLNYIPIAQAAGRLGVSRDRLMKAVYAGECEHRVMRFGTRGKAIELPMEELERLERSRRAWVSEDEACEHLGVPESILKNMLAAQVLVHDPLWRNDILKAGAVEQASVVALGETIRRFAREQATTQPLVRWSELTSRRMGERAAIQSTMKAAATGEIRAVHLGKTLGEAAFLRDDVMRYFGIPVLEAGMTVHQLEQSAKWKWECIAYWIEQGLLKCDEIELRGQRTKVISPEQLLGFMRTYVPLSDLARELNTRPSVLSDKLAGVEIVGAKTDTSGAKRGGLIQLKDLGRLAIVGLAASRGALYGQQSLL